MKKELLICLLAFFVVAFAAQNQTESEPFTPIVNTDGDVVTKPNQLFKEMAQAKLSNDIEKYNQLLEESKSQLPVRTNNDLWVHAEKVDPPVPAMRYGNDIVIYSGDVFYNEWAMLSDIDDEAISVDYHRGDTLVAAVACADSLVRIFKSYDQGLNWSYVYWLSATGGLSEPEVIYGTDGLWYHVLARSGSGNGNLAYYNIAGDEGTWNGDFIEGSADSVQRFTVCTDKTDYTTDYWLYVAYHQGVGGIGADQILFSYGYSYGTGWAAWDTIQFTGSMFPDLAYGDGDLFLTRLYEPAADDKRVYCRVSTDLGGSWAGSVLIQQDSVTKQGPQIAATTDGSNDAWVIFPRRDPTTANNDYGLRTSWTQDGGANWGSPIWVNSQIGEMEVLPSIAVFSMYGANSWYPYVTFINSVDDWSAPTVNSFNLQSDTTWAADASNNDHEPEFVRPIQTFSSDADGPAFAYVGSAGANVYYDSWSNTQIEENTSNSTPSITTNIRPNPFVKLTHIEYSLTKQGNVTIGVYNALGQQVSTLVNAVKPTGTHNLEWTGIDNNGSQLPKGIYFLKVKTTDTETTKKVVIE